ncbi:MAG: GntR family transcriptional regulator [Ruminococcaceae bacterium]|nr:GntR family transcriptional regulator [Oscillospiraceae bacterium]
MGVITVDTRDRKPIYEQLTDNIRGLVLRGVMKPHEQLPSVRALAVELAINPNTIQKAYTELERRGITYSIPGRGSFISDNLNALSHAEQEKAGDALRSALTAAHDAGIPREEALAMLERIYGGAK